MSTETIEDDGNFHIKNPETPFTPWDIENAQAISEKTILDATIRIKWELNGILWDNEIVKEHKWIILWNLEGYVSQINSILEWWWSEEYIWELTIFKNFLEEQKAQLLSTLTSEEKAELDKPKSTWTWASNNYFYKANRYIWMKKKSKRMF